MPQVITIWWWFGFEFWIIVDLVSLYIFPQKKTLSSCVACTLYRWRTPNDLCVLQAPNGRGSRVSESQRAPTTRAAAGELTEAHQIKKGSNSFAYLFTWNLFLCLLYNHVSMIAPNGLATVILFICNFLASNKPLFGYAEPPYGRVHFWATEEGNQSWNVSCNCTQTNELNWSGH